MQADVLSFVDHAHAAAAQFLDDAVVRDGLPDHWAEILGPEIRQVNEGVEVGGVPERQLAIHPHYAQKPQLTGEQTAQACDIAWLQQLGERVRCWANERGYKGLKRVLIWID